MQGDYQTDRMSSGGVLVDDAAGFVLSDRDIMRVERTVLDNFYLVSNAACRLDG